jgi:hypothetical protein
LFSTQWHLWVAKSPPKGAIGGKRFVATECSERFESVPNMTVLAARSASAGGQGDDVCAL